MGFYNNIGQSKIIITQLQEFFKDKGIKFQSNNVLIEALLFALMDKRKIKAEDLHELSVYHVRNKCFNEWFFKKYNSRRFHILYNFDTHSIHFYGIKSNIKESIAKTELNLTKEVLDMLDIKYTRYGSFKQRNIRFEIE